MADTIAQAWRDMVANRPVLPEEIGPLVKQILNELSGAAGRGGIPISQDKLSEPFQLGHGFSIHHFVTVQLPNWHTRVEASIVGPGHTELFITAEVDLHGQQLSMTVAPPAAKGRLWNGSRETTLRNVGCWRISGNG